MLRLSKRGDRDRQLGRHQSVIGKRDSRAYNLHQDARDRSSSRQRGIGRMISMKTWLESFVILCAVLCGQQAAGAAPSSAAAAPSDKVGEPALVVFAAASLTNVLQELGDGFTRETGIKVKFSFAASSALARQIENGAPADVFFSADVEWMDYLQTRKLIDPESRHDVVGNRLGRIAPADSLVQLPIGPNFPLAAALAKGRLATGDPDSVPVGRYAR